MKPRHRATDRCKKSRAILRGTFLLADIGVPTDGRKRKRSLDAEEALSVFVRQGDDFICAHAANFCEFCRDMGHIARVVARAAHGNGGHVRAVRFEKHPVKRDDLCDLDGLLRVLVGQRAVKAQVPAALYQLLRDLDAAGKAMEHAAHLRKLLHDGEAVSMRVAVVHDDGET